ncbi:MAG: c-type cytochrome [Nitrospirae bacterium]|nr:c-type cytochrome [Nitrospirota bacterium]MDE3042813.1 c-type cytochrome [Nitrospirota bacterium]MDE3050456.1 c-type cytochrome [Nitrospirota bacterium]MDE3218261.1 c-type cytochrome [Nitrospirota bacterium]
MNQSRSHRTRRCAFVPGIAVSMAALLIFASSGIAAPADPGEKIVKSLCVRCHRIEGKPAPRRTKKAPDLIWAGNKYQRDWLVAWLQNPEFKHYPVGYDFRPERKKRHLSLPVDQAKAVTDFLATHKDARIKEGVMKPGTPEQLERGGKLYREHGCQNCHLTPAKTAKGYAGGTSSTSFIKLNERLQADWIYRFNQNPNDFEPDSGAYIPKPPLPDEDIYAITAYMMTLK